MVPFLHFSPFIHKLTLTHCFYDELLFQGTFYKLKNISASYSALIWSIPTFLGIFCVTSTSFLCKTLNIFILADVTGFP